MQFGDKPLFENISVKFGDNNRYGLIGANGCGKSTLIKILGGDLEPTNGHVSIGEHQRLGKLRQDHFAFEEFSVIDTVVMGHEKLWKLKQERDSLYAQEELSEEDGMRAGDLESEFADMDGYSAEPNAGDLLIDMGIPVEAHYNLMKSIAPGLKLRVLLAQALFGDPDVILLDEPTKNFDLMVPVGERVAVIGPNGIGKTTLLRCLAGDLKATSGEIKWSENVKLGYYAQDHSADFADDESLFDWMAQWKREEHGEQEVRGNLGRMLFSQNEIKKSVKALSGGEKGRMLFGKFMFQNPNVMLLDEPTNHMDMEFIESLNIALENYPGTLIFVSHDRELIASVATRIIELTPAGIVDYHGTYEEYLKSQGVA